MFCICERELCTGCEACVQSCPTKSIKMSYDSEGFLYPIVDEEKCTGCGLCKKICLRKEKKEKSLKIAYALQNRNKDELLNSSSGAFFPEVAKYIIKNDGAVFGAAFDDSFNIIQKKITSWEELTQLRGSKYVQSRTLDTYNEAIRCLENDQMVLYSGTPCQIAGLKALVSDKLSTKLFTLSIICYGVPAPAVWAEYISSLSNGEIVNEVVFRKKYSDKECWKNYYLYLKYDGHEYCQESKDDLFYRAFDNGILFRNSCYKCKCKGEDQLADIVMGDYWGADKIFEDFFDNEKGISAVIINSEKGLELFNKIKGFFKVCDGSFDYLVKKNMVSKIASFTPARERFYKRYLETSDLLSSISYALES